VEIERHLDALLGVRFLASEYATGRTHGGRIDTLGIDENNRPVIVEYKRALNENVINQGLFYLNWLMDHKAELKLLVLDRYGKDAADTIEWASPRLLCIAGDFTKYDEHAIQQIPRSIELIRYRRYGDDLLLFELVNATAAEPMGNGIEQDDDKPKPKPSDKTIVEKLALAPREVRDRYAALDAFLKALGADVQVNTLKYYVAYKRIKNFACVEVHPQQKRIAVYVKVDPDSVVLEPGFTADLRAIGHYGTGDLKITIDDDRSLERAHPLLARSYEAS
jgi:predicted transport protein